MKDGAAFSAIKILISAPTIGLVKMEVLASIQDREATHVTVQWDSTALIVNLPQMIAKELPVSTEVFV